LQWAFIHALLSRVPFALAGLSCYKQQRGEVLCVTRNGIQMTMYSMQCTAGCVLPGDFNEVTARHHHLPIAQNPRTW